MAKKPWSFFSKKKKSAPAAGDGDEEVTIPETPRSRYYCPSSMRDVESSSGEESSEESETDESSMEEQQAAAPAPAPRPDPMAAQRAAKAAFDAIRKGVALKRTPMVETQVEPSEPWWKQAYRNGEDWPAPCPAISSGLGSGMARIEVRAPGLASVESHEVPEGQAVVLGRHPGASREDAGATAAEP